MEARTAMNVREPAPGLRVIDIEGEITAFSEGVFSEAFSQASSGDVKAVALNFADLEYMNSGGIGLLVTMLIRAQRNNQKLAAYGLNDHYRQILSLTRLDEAIEIHPDEEATKAALS